MQFSGALLLGRGVTSTIKSGIVDPEAFEDSPEILMYGMFSALLAAGIWLLVATAYELPVSTTHSIFGCALPACLPDAVLRTAVSSFSDAYAGQAAVCATAPLVAWPHLVWETTLSES